MRDNIGQRHFVLLAALRRSEGRPSAQQLHLLADEQPVPQEVDVGHARPPSPDELFYDAVVARGLHREPGFGGLPGEFIIAGALIESGRQVCEATPKGIPPNPSNGLRDRTPAEYLIVNEGVLTGSPEGERAKLAIQYLCPENLPYLEQALSGSPPRTPR